MILPAMLSAHQFNSPYEQKTEELIDSAKVLSSHYQSMIFPDSSKKVVLKLLCGSQHFSLIDEAAFQFTIGRHESSLLRLLDDIEVSRFHAKIERLNPGEFHLIDCGSTNGTLVNGRRINGPTLLKNGDKILIGETAIHLLPGHQSSSLPFREAKTVTGLPRVTPPAETHVANHFAEYVELAFESIQRGCVEEIESTLAIHIDRLIHEGAQSHQQADMRLHQAIAISLEMAEALRSKAWLERTVQVHESFRKLMDSDCHLRIQALARRMGIDPRQRLHAYTDALRNDQYSSITTLNHWKKFENAIDEVFQRSTASRFNSV